MSVIERSFGYLFELLFRGFDLIFKPLVLLCSLLLPFSEEPRFNRYSGDTRAKIKRYWLRCGRRGRQALVLFGNLSLLLLLLLPADYLSYALLPWIVPGAWGYYLNVLSVRIRLGRL